MAGAENGNNSAITKNSPNVDANGMYTVQQGDTWTDLAQRTTGDMNNYQKMFDQQKGGAGSNIDNMAVGTQVNLKDFLNDTGNNGVPGQTTNPAGGGSDKNIATPEVNTSAATGDAQVATTPPGNAAVDAVPDPAPAVETAAPTPTPTPGPGDKAGSLRNRTARDWLRWAGAGHDHSGDAAASPSATDTAAGSEAAPTAAPTTSPGAAPATNPATNPETGTPSASDVYDPNDPAQVQSQNSSIANPGMSSTMPSMSNMNMNDVGSMVGQGVGIASDIASGIGGAMSGGGLASGIGGLASGIGSAIGGIFSSRRDAEDWRRYAYPEGGGDDFDPKTLPHIPFAGSGSPGPVEYTTSEEYADKARKKMDDVTDLGDDPLSTPMGEWQKQGSIDPADNPEFVDHAMNYLRNEAGRPRSTGDPADNPEFVDHAMNYLRNERDAYDDDSDIVRSFQANLGNTALGSGAGGGGRFDDFSSAAQGFLRTAGRNYSLSEQSELIREGDKGGAGNLRSLDLAGTHYEDMDSLGW